MRNTSRAVALLAAMIALASCGHKATTESTTTTTTATTSAPAMQGATTQSGAMRSTAAGGAMASGSVDTGVHQPPGFADEATAKARCPQDEVVWLNTKSHVYHEKGMVYYGHTQHGAYVCRKEADALGDRLTQNGK